MLRHGLVAAATIAALVAPAYAGRALDEARKAVDASDYLTARSKLTEALAAGEASPEDLAEIYKLTGVVEGALGESETATNAFAKWLALDPKAELPAGTSPKITRPFTAAQGKARRHGGLKVKTETSASPPSVTLVVVADPFEMIASVRAFVRADGERERTIDGAPGKAVALPDGKRLDVRLAALDKYGNRVVELGSEDVPIVVLGERQTQTTEPPHGRRVNDLHDVEVRDGPRNRSRPLYAKWWVWGAGAIAFGGAATAFGLAARSNASDLDHLNATSPDHDFSEAHATESAARRDALLFNVGVGVAGALAVGAAILYVTDPAHHHSTRVGAMPAHGGGALVVGGTF